jgi:hypothetical protein
MTSKDFRETSAYLPDFDLLEFLFRDGHGQRGLSEWPGDYRAQFSGALARVLVNERLLDAHVRSLKEEDEGHACQVSFPEDKIGAVVSGGLEVLDNATMVALALDPSALGLIHHAIYEEMSLVWFKAMVDEGRIELQVDGFSVPTIKDLLDAARPDGLSLP